MKPEESAPVMTVKGKELDEFARFEMCKEFCKTPYYDIPDYVEDKLPWPDPLEAFPYQNYEMWSSPFVQEVNLWPALLFRWFKRGRILRVAGYTVAAVLAAVIANLIAHDLPLTLTVIGVVAFYCVTGEIVNNVGEKKMLRLYAKNRACLDTALEGLRFNHMEQWAVKRYAFANRDEFWKMSNQWKLVPEEGTGELLINLATGKEWRRRKPAA